METCIKCWNAISFRFPPSSSFFFSTITVWYRKVEIWAHPWALPSLEDLCAHHAGSDGSFLGVHVLLQLLCNPRRTDFWEYTYFFNFISSTQDGFLEVHVLLQLYTILIAHFQLRFWVGSEYHIEYMSHHHNQLQTAQEERRKETHDKLVFLNLLLIEGYSLFLLSKLIVYGQDIVGLPPIMMSKKYSVFLAVKKSLISFMVLFVEFPIVSWWIMCCILPKWWKNRVLGNLRGKSPIKRFSV